MNYIIIIALFLAVLFYDYLKVVKGKKNGVFWMYTVLLLASLAIFLMQEGGIKVLNPTRPILYLIKDVLKLG